MCPIELESPDLLDEVVPDELEAAEEAASDESIVESEVTVEVKVDGETATVTTTELEAAVERQCEMSEIDEILNAISEAEIDCRRAEAVVNDRKFNLKIAEEHYDGCVERLRELASNIRRDVDRPLFKYQQPMVAEAVTDVAPDSGEVVSDAPVSQDKPAQPDDNAWKAESIDVLADSLTETVRESLRRGDVATLGELADLIARCEHGDNWPKGIGPAKVTKIVDALTEYQNQLRQAASSEVEVEAVESESADETAAPLNRYPTAEAWEAMSHRKQVAWFNARAVELDSDDIENLDLRNTENEEAWQAGVDSYSEDDTASNCPYAPSVDADAWLQGWLWAGKQDQGSDSTQTAE